MHFAILGILIVLVIAFFVVVWKAAPHWRWYQIVAVSVTMLLAVIFLFPVAGVLRSRSAWHQVKEDLEQRLDREAAENKELKYGDPTNPSVGEGVRPLSQKLSKLGIEAGRRWRHLRLRNAEGREIVLAKPPPEAVPGVEPEEDPEPGNSPLVPEGMVVYGFSERPAEGVAVPIPRLFLGEFRVSASTPTQVTLEPTGQLAPGARQAISDRQATSWSLYELLPLDAHEPFIAEGSEPSDENLFGRVDEDLVRKLLERQAQNPDLQAVFDATLEEYLRDGSRASGDDPPETRWTMIEFTERHSISVDSPDQRGALDGGYFDGSGRAVDSRLQRGEEGEVTFDTGDRIVVKEEAADGILELGVAREIDRFFIRPLNDYRFAIRRTRLMLDELANRKTQLEFEQQVLTDATDKTTRLIQREQEVRNNLEQDLAQFQVERNAIKSFHETMDRRVSETKETLVRLFRDNQRLQAELKQIHRAIRDRIDAVTATVD